MSKRKDGQARGKYTLEFKLEAVRLAKGGQAVAVTAELLGALVQTPGSWVRLSDIGQLKGAGDKPVSPEQMKLARLRAELSRVKMERNFTPEAPNHVWSSDITCIVTDEGRLHLTGVIDLFNRQVNLIENTQEVKNL